RRRLYRPDSVPCDRHSRSRLRPVRHRVDSRVRWRSPGGLRRRDVHLAPPPNLTARALRRIRTGGTIVPPVFGCQRSLTILQGRPNNGSTASSGRNLLGAILAAVSDSTLGGSNEAYRLRLV